MYRFLGRWLLRIFLLLAAAFVAAYAGDTVVYLLRGSPHAKVSVHDFMSVPLKGDKLEYDYLGTVDVPCAVSLFPQGGQNPCWYLRRSPNQWEKL